MGIGAADFGGAVIHEIDEILIAVAAVVLLAYVIADGFGGAVFGGNQRFIDQIFQRETLVDLDVGPHAGYALFVVVDKAHGTGIHDDHFVFEILGAFIGEDAGHHLGQGGGEHFLVGIEFIDRFAGIHIEHIDSLAAGGIVGLEGGVNLCGGAAESQTECRREQQRSQRRQLFSDTG